jgi:hypothetical protein
VERFLSDTIDPVELAIPQVSVSHYSLAAPTPARNQNPQVQAPYLLDFLRFFAALRFFGTFAPAARASESPIAIACLRLVTLRPERPLLNVPALRSFIARSTLAEAFFEYFRAMIILPVTGNQSLRQVKVPGPGSGPSSR